MAYLGYLQLDDLLKTLGDGSGWTFVDWPDGQERIRKIASVGKAANGTHVRIVPEGDGGAAVQVAALRCEGPYDDGVGPDDLSDWDAGDVSGDSMGQFTYTEPQCRFRLRHDGRRTRNAEAEAARQRAARAAQEAESARFAAARAAHEAAFDARQVDPIKSDLVGKRVVDIELRHPVATLTFEDRSKLVIEGIHVHGGYGGGATLRLRHDGREADSHGSVYFER
jgi:hypothetical protein